MTTRPTSPVPRPVAGTAVRESDPGTPRLRTQNLWWRWVFGLTLAVQLIAVYSPQGPAGPEITGLDKVVHVAIFCAPSFAVLMMGLRARWALGMLALLALHAPVSELIQHFVLPQRDGDVFDALADLGGVALGGVAYLVWRRRHP